jgi:Glucodextranase, domain B
VASEHGDADRDEKKDRQLRSRLHPTTVARSARPTALAVTLPSPKLASPVHNHEIDFDTQKELRLAWDGVDGAQRYALNVARNQLFAKNIIEDEQRRLAWARVGIGDEGTFYWRVAAVDSDGARGKWSETRSFRVASLKGVAGTEDKTPPELTLEEVRIHGIMVLVSGRTEPGATVTINGEPVSVQLSGYFNKTIQMKEAGRKFITAVATDAWGNSTEEKRRVFIDAF